MNLVERLDRAAELAPVIRERKALVALAMVSPEVASKTGRKISLVDKDGKVVREVQSDEVYAALLEGHADVEFAVAAGKRPQFIACQYVLGSGKPCRAPRKIAKQGPVPTRCKKHQRQEDARLYRVHHVDEVRQAQRRSVQANPESKRDASRRYALAHPAKVVEKSRRYRKANAEKVRAKDRAYREANRSKRAEQAKLWRAKKRAERAATIGGAA